MLKAMKGQLDAMLSFRSRVLVVRLDLHVSEYTGDNRKVSRMLSKLKRWLLEQYQMSKVGHVWVREQERAKKQHYHLALMLDGRLVRHPSKVIKWVEQYWEFRNDPKPYTPRSCYTMVTRRDEESYNKAFYRLSYLAKDRGKGYKDVTANNYSVSRLKRRSVDLPAAA